MNNLDKECIKSEIKDIDRKMNALIKKKTSLTLKLSDIINDTCSEDERLRDEYSVKYCFQTIRDEGCLWDLRFWNGEKRYFEVIDWLDNIIDINKNADKNCGHTSFCIYILLEIHKVDKDKVIDAVMENNKVSYRDNQGELV